MTIEPRGVIDTNVVILLPQLTDPSLLPQEPTNPSDFEAISGLDVRTVPHPEAAVSPPPEE